MNATRREFAQGAAALAAVCGLGAAGQPAPPRKVEFTDEQSADLDRVSAYLNALKSLKSGFVQINQDGNIVQGSFYLQKPGRLRFEYQPPDPTLIVAVGGSIYVKNGRLNTVDRYDLSDTPLGLLLDSSVDLKRNPAVTGIDRENGALVLRAKSSANRNQDNIAIVFSAPQIELRQWTVRDAQGGSTSVALTRIEPGAVISDTLFAVPVKAPPVRKGGN